MHLKLDAFDFSTPYGQIDWHGLVERLTERHLAVIVPHFFGIPADFRPLIDAARQKGVYIIEDCAHTLGATIDGHVAGTLGDATIFSFNYDKPISLAGGGALLLNNPNIVMPAPTFRQVSNRHFELREIRRLFQTLSFRRRLTGRLSLAQRVVGKLGMAPYAGPAVASGIGPLRAALGLDQLERYEAVRQLRTHNAELILSGLQRTGWHVAPHVKPSFLKLRIVGEPAELAEAAASLMSQRIRLVNSNWARLLVPEKESIRYPNAMVAAKNGVDVPIHQNCTFAEIDTIKIALARVRANPACAVRVQIAEPICRAGYIESMA